MKLRRIIAALGAGLLILGSCGGPEAEEPVLPAALGTSVTQLEADPGSIFLTVTASQAWSITSSATWARVSPASGTGSRNSVILTYDSNDGDESRSVTLTLTADPGGQASLTLTQKAAAVVPGGGDEPREFGYGYDVAPVHWLELPATKAGDGKEWFAHNMDGGDYFSGTGKQRNWSFYYDYDSYLSSWVAYPLNNGLIGKGTRTNAWGYDPLLPAGYQQAIVNGAYGISTLSRGHQLPSADRLTYSANVSTFYATNMTPQDYDFNGEIWADLENKVRSYASQSDTLYVVTGCIVDDSSGSLTDRGGHTVRIPSAYFKALLRYYPSSTTGDVYTACGFYLPHSSSISGDSFQKYMMSIGELEKKTGMEFFVNLAEKVGADKAKKIKSQEPGSWWK